MSIHYADHLERYAGEALTEAGVRFVHESQNKTQRLDFYLPDYDVYIEVKQFHTERVNDQLCLNDNVILLQGKKSVQLFIELLDR